MRQWLLQANKHVRSEQLDDQTEIIEQRVISSLKLMELILFIEHLSGQSLDPSALSVGSFQSIDAIYKNFFGKS